MTVNDRKWACLHSHSEYSILDGYARIKDYVKTAKAQGATGFGLTDHGTCAGLYEMIEECNKEGIQPVPGFEAYVAPEHPDGARNLSPTYYGPNGIKAKKYDVSGNGAYLHLTLFAYNETGLKNLLELTSLAWDKAHYYLKPRIDSEMLFKHSEGLIVTTGCPSSEISTRFLLGQDDKAYEYASRLKSVFGDKMFVEVMDHSMKNEDLERILLPKLRKLSEDLNIPLLATNDCHYVLKSDADPHERMLAMQTKRKMDEPSFNEGGTRFAFSGPEYYMKTDEEMRKLFPENLYPGAVDNTNVVLDMCEEFKLDYDPHLRPEIEIPDGYTEVTYLKKLITEGFLKKRGSASEEIQNESKKRIKEEFEVIHSNDFVSYFLVVNDYIDWAHNNGVPVGVGRGCFVPGTKVKTGNGIYRNIEKITKGERVLTHDNTYQEVEDTFIYDVEKEDMVELTLSNGRTINSTSDHLVFDKQRGFIKAGELSIGDVVLGAKGSKSNFIYKCDCCSKEISLIKRELDKRKAKGNYKPVGEYWCYDCVKGNLHKIPEVELGSTKGAQKSKTKEVKDKISSSLKKHWEENYDERISSWHEYMKTPEYEEYRKSRRIAGVKKYSDPELLQKLTEQGKGKYKKGYFVSYQQEKKEIYFASSFEEKALTILETDSKVKSFDRCKRRIPYIKPSTGLEHNYLPDIEVEYKDGTLLVIEVKAEWQLKEEDTASKLKQAEAFFRNEGIEFQIWTENTLKTLNDEWHNDITVIGIKKYTYTGKVYDLQVANVHNYTTEGVTVHNSVGGSEIAYVLDISDTDPIRFDLLFERFLSPGRGSLYRIEYEDGTYEDISVAEKKTVKTPEGEVVQKYIHELADGDVLIEEGE